MLRSLESACFWNKVHEVEPLFDLLDDGAGDLPIMSMSLITLTADGVSHTHPYATHSLSHFPSPLSLSLRLSVGLSVFTSVIHARYQRF